MNSDNNNSFNKSSVQLRKFSAFSQVSPDALDEIYSHLNILKFRVGQALVESTLLPANVYLLLKGECRLVANDQGQLSTFAKIGPGSLIGLASLLRSEPCEDVSAVTEVIAIAFPDQLIVNLFSNEPSFRNWCNTQIWPSELISLLQCFRRAKPQQSGSLRDDLLRLSTEAQLVPQKTLKEKSLFAELLINRSVYIASANTSLKVGTSITAVNDLPQSNTLFDLRLISLPVATISADRGNNKLKIDYQDAPEISPRSSLELEQANSLFSFKIVRGVGPLQETLSCFQMLSKMMKLPFRRDAIEKVINDSLRRGQKPSIQLCGSICAGLGLHVVHSKVPATMGSRLLTPCLLQWDGGFVLGVKSNAKGLLIASPRHGHITLNLRELEDAYPEGIDILQVERMVHTPEERFGPSWFLPALKPYKSVLIQVFVASFVVQLFTLANPLLIQVIIDKVISQRSLDTLQVLGFGLLVVTLLEGLLGSLKTFLFAETTNRIDQRLGSEVIDHLLRLPLAYFDRRPVGELGTRVAELEKIRNFLTGQALTTILDAIFSIIYIVVMVVYSSVLTLIALSVLPLQIGITILGGPLFRKQFRQAAEENAKTQSHLVEVLTGIQTVKAQNVEMVSRWKWQDFYGRYISRTYEKTITATAYNQTSQVLQKISQLLVLWVGASMVLSGTLTLGQLIAFRIISGYVTQPLLRLSTIWQSIQELRISFERLADVIDTPLESSMSDQANIPLPPIDGNVKFKDVSFAFKDNSLVLKKINLEVESGTFMGIVGQSGSGKSTLMKLLPRLYSPNSGVITIDGYDIAKIELYSLRRQIGIVPQDPLLFTGTIAENISLTNPEADTDEIINAARLACAHDFIMTLPLGYSTPVGERGGSLSGGQRQRIAIARTLLSKPKLLVLDEATSALDFATEKALCNNLLDNLKDCTVFFITHRLPTIRRADTIIMMHQGVIVETGTHESLIQTKGRYYALYRHQDSSQ